jgi:hypothetical protein
MWTDGEEVVLRMPYDKADREKKARQDDLRRLRAALARLRDDLARVRVGTSQLTAIELGRPLTPDEVKQARQLTTESERLRWELASLRQEFELLHKEEGRIGG